MTNPTDLTRRATLGAMIGGLALAGAAWSLPARAQDAPEFVMGELTMGDPDAPVTIIEYASLTCPHCARFHVNAFQDIKRDYIETGKAKLLYREVYFDRLGLYGGLLARCGGKDKYFGFIDLLLRRQKDWSRDKDLLGAFQKIGRLGGLSDAQVETCLNDQDKARALVQQYQEYRNDPRLTGTPTLIVEGAKIDNPTTANLAAAIEANLAN